MILRKARVEDCEWVYKTLEVLRSPVTYSLEQFETYFKLCLNSDFFSFYIFCDQDKKVGLVSLNKFYMPRYLGFGYEMEEFVVHEKYRGNGFSYKMIDAVKTMLKDDPSVRKLIIKTNGEDSKHIYAKALKQTNLVTYQEYLNKL